MKQKKRKWQCNGARNCKNTQNSFCSVASVPVVWDSVNTFELTMRKQSACHNSCQRSLFLREEYTKRTLCHTCGVSCAGKTAYLNSIESHGEQVKSKPFCELCPCATQRPRNLQLHRVHMYPTLPCTRSHVCGKCGRAFFEFFSQSAHGLYAFEKQTIPVQALPKGFLQFKILRNSHENSFRRVVSANRPFTWPTSWKSPTEYTRARSPRNVRSVKHHLFRRTVLMCTWRNAWREMGWMWFGETKVAWEL